MGEDQRHRQGDDPGDQQRPPGPLVAAAQGELLLKQPLLLPLLFQFCQFVRPQTLPDPFL